MASDSHPDLSPLARKLTSIYPLTDEEQQALLELPMQIRELRADQDVVREGDRPSRSCLVLEGFTFRYKLVGEDGRRQIMSFYISGDMPDLMSLHLLVMDNTICTLARSKLGFVDHHTLRNLIRNYPRIGEALWRDTLIDAAIYREWLAGIGRRNAYSRIAHLLCEMFVRMQAVGLADGLSVRLPITQGTISDALGLSPVHVNRVVQELRTDGLIGWNKGVLNIKDWDELQRAGEFDATYLHLHEGVPV